MRIRKRKVRSRGVIMIIAAFVMLIVAALVLGMLQLRSSEIQSLGNKMRQAAASYIADAGVEQAIWYLRMYKQPMWEWGTPNYAGVVTQDASGSATGHVWATRLNGNYPNGIFYQEKLVTPEITASSAAPDLCWCDILNNDADASDDAQILLTRDKGSTWSSINTPANRGDALNAWTRRSQNMAAVVSGDTIRIAFLLYSNANLNDPGWYIDNVIVAASGTCGALACNAAPASYDFYDDMENGIGGWEYWIEPNQNAFGIGANTYDSTSFPNDFPPNSGNFYWISFDPRFASTDTWIILGRGIYQGNTGKVEAKVSVHGGSPPYDVKVQYWKRTM